jgi:outer membrane receptor protein involved in Fe transport
MIDMRLVGGIDLEYSPGEHVEQSIDPVREGKIFTSFTEISTVYDYDVRFTQVSPYLHVEAAPIPRLRTSAGFRLDLLGYDYENHLSVVTTGRYRRAANTTRTYAHPSPKLGATYQLGSAGSIFVSYAHAFRIPSEDQLFRQGATHNTLDLQPVKADNFEAGIRANPLHRLNVDVSLYRMIKTDDIVSYSDLDGNQTITNAGKTSHRGLEVGVRLEAGKGLGLQAGYSYAVHRFEEWQPNDNLNFGGNEIDVAPRTIANLVVTYQPPFVSGGHLSLEWSRLGDYWMDPANTVKFAGHHLFNLRATAELPGGFSVFARLMNLAHLRYADRATYTAFRGEELAPGLPRTLYLGLEYRVRAEP